MIDLVRARTADQFSAAKQLFLEYAESLGFSLCFQGFDEELKNLSLLYGPPSGEMILAKAQSGEFVGCVGVKKIDNTICEMKRLYVKPEFRGERIGERLVRESILTARALGYQRMRLDTIREKMKPAISLYLKEGFVEIPAYYPNPLAGVLYFELDLLKAQKILRC